MDKEKLKEGTKFDENKLRHDLIPPFAYLELIKVYTFGVKKYDDWNWAKGIKYSRIIGALLRHTFYWLAGEKIDPETGIHHMAHAAWNCLALVHYDTFPQKYKEFDDRYLVDYNQELINEIRNFKFTKDE